MAAETKRSRVANLSSRDDAWREHPDGVNRDEIALLKQEMERAAGEHALRPVQTVVAAKEPPGLLNWLRTRTNSTAGGETTPGAGGGAGGGGGDDELPTVLTKNFRTWLNQSMAKLSEDGETPDTIAYVPMEGDSDGDLRIKLERNTTNATVTLSIIGVDISYLELKGVVWPRLEINVRDCDVNLIDLSGSHFNSVELRNLSSRWTEGIFVYADRTKVDSDFWIIGAQTPQRLTADAKSIYTLPFRQRNYYARITAIDLAADQFLIWNVVLLGGHFLNYLKSERETEKFAANYPLYAPGLQLFRAHLRYFVAHGCSFHAPVALRFASIASETKFRFCEFKGYFADPPQASTNDNRPKPRVPVLDEFDREKREPLTGLVLDVSRADLGREFIFRYMDPASTGWMNWSHAKAGILNDDASLWRQTGKSTEKRMRFRLNGFQYDDLVDQRVSAAKETLRTSIEPPQKKGKPATGLKSTDPAKEAEIRARLLSKESELKEQPPRWEDTAVAQRKQWLYSQVERDLREDFKAQPWTQCARAFLKAGDRSSADEIFLERERLWHRSLWRSNHMLKWAFHEVFNSIHGYGYRPQWPLYWAFGIWLISIAFFSCAFNEGFLMQNPDATNQVEVKNAAQSNTPKPAQPTAQPTVQPTVQPAAQPTTTTTTSSRAPAADGMRERELQPRGNGQIQIHHDERYATFFAAVYSLDLLVPVAELGQSAYWLPGIDPQRVRRGIARNWTIEQRETAVNFVWAFYWTQVVLGWILSTMVAAGMAGYLQRPE